VRAKGGEVCCRETGVVPTATNWVKKYFVSKGRRPQYDPGQYT
jgi:hypothetical protein